MVPRSAKRDACQRHGFALLALDILAPQSLAHRFPASALPTEVAAVTTAAADTRTATAPISARIDADDAATLRAIAERNHSTVSRLVAVCVRQGLPALGARSDVHDTARAAA